MGAYVADQVSVFVSGYISFRVVDGLASPVGRLLPIWIIAIEVEFSTQSVAATGAESGQSTADGLTGDREPSCGVDEIEIGDVQTEEWERNKRGEGKRRTIGC